MSDDEELKKGDRVVVKLGAAKRWYGVIIGEARDGHAWQIVKDGTKWARGIHKSFCQRDRSDIMMRD